MIAVLNVDWQTLADALALFGAAYTGEALLGVSATTFYNGLTSGFLGFADVASGLLKSVVFGLVMALASCHFGLATTGGQRQRLAIARALVKPAGIFVFDDSFSALDFATDARLRAALADGLASATVLIVAQRVGTIMTADRIVVMDDGRVVGIGTHAELLASNETYREIVYSQLSEAEVAA